MITLPQLRPYGRGYYLSLLRSYSRARLVACCNVCLVMIAAAPITCADATFGADTSATAAATKGMVASVQPLATEAGLAALRKGGNAIDAAIAVGLTLGVVDTHNSGLGGGCFILIRRADGKLFAIDGREMAPAKATRNMFLKGGKADSDLSQMGPHAVIADVALGIESERAGVEAALLLQAIVDLVAIRGKDGKFPGIPVTELTADQKQHLQNVVKLVFEPYRNADRDEVHDCLKKQGGLDACSLAFYAQGDIGDDGVWDNWRLEGPSFIFYFRGSPHVHMWVNVGSDPAVKLNA